MKLYIGLQVELFEEVINTPYHSEYSSRFLNAKSFDRLEHIHHSLCLTHLNGIHHRTEHTNTTHCVTVCMNITVNGSISMHMACFKTFV